MHQREPYVLPHGCEPIARDVDRQQQCSRGVQPPDIAKGQGAWGRDGERARLERKGKPLSPSPRKCPQLGLKKGFQTRDETPAQEKHPLLKFTSETNNVDDDIIAVVLGIGLNDVVRETSTVKPQQLRQEV